MYIACTRTCTPTSHVHVYERIQDMYSRVQWTNWYNVDASALIVYRCNNDCIVAPANWRNRFIACLFYQQCSTNWNWVHVTGTRFVRTGTMPCEIYNKLLFSNNCSQSWNETKSELLPPRDDVTTHDDDEAGWRQDLALEILKPNNATND